MARLFKYTAFEPTGKKIKGIIEGEDMETVSSSLAHSGIAVFEIKPANPVNPVFSKAGRLYTDLTAKSVERKELIEFANNLAVLLRAGIPLSLALRDMSDATDSAILKKAIGRISWDIEMGSALWGAFSKQKVFPDIFPKLIKIGEEAGELDKTLEHIANHLDKIDELVRTIKNALLYPSFIVFMSIVALSFWLLYVLPQLTGFFREMGVTLPIITRALIWSADFARGSWPLFLVIFAILFVLYKLAVLEPRLKYMRDALKLKLPLTKHIVYNSQLAFTVEYLRIMIGAGLTIDKSLSITAGTIDNEVFKRALSMVNEEITHGSTIYDAFKNRTFGVRPLFPGMFYRMLKVGEESGNLDDQLSFLSDHYSKILKDVSLKISKIIEPIMLIIVGGVFAFIFIGLFIPIYDLVSEISRQ